MLACSVTIKLSRSKELKSNSTQSNQTYIFQWSTFKSSSDFEFSDIFSQRFHAGRLVGFAFLLFHFCFLLFPAGSHFVFAACFRRPFCFSCMLRSDNVDLYFSDQTFFIYYFQIKLSIAKHIYLYTIHFVQFKYLLVIYFNFQFEHHHHHHHLYVTNTAV